MLGHKLWQVLSTQFETNVTFRTSRQNYERYGIFDSHYTHGYISAENIDDIIRLVGDVRPTVVINCIGLVKQRPTGQEIRRSILVNSLFPHRLSEICHASGAKMIQISTDCVYSGNKGGYLESDVADPVDLYGRTKLLGEIAERGHLTIRTSMIGRELEHTQGLLEWFLGQQGQSVSGFTKAIFSGFTTLALARIVADIIENHPTLQGIYHISADPISKYDLLMLIKEIYDVDTEIVPNVDHQIDRSLNSDLFRQATGITIPDWREMIEAMRRDETSYESARK
jgi:dTDP-4-dehydrorhamnose reductase